MTTAQTNGNFSSPSSEGLHLICGATGILGREVAAQLAGAGKRVRALVRDSATPEKRAALAALPVECVGGDLKDRDSLRLACQGVQTAVSAVTALLSQQAGDSLETVDAQGNLALIEIAKAAGVGRFVFISIPPSPTDYAFQRAKQTVEGRLRESGLSYTILRPAHFMEAWLSPYPPISFDPLGGTVQLFGSGEARTNWISVRDVARFVSAAVDGDKLKNQTVHLGGPDPLSQLEIVKIFEELGAPPITASPSPDLLDSLKHARSPNEEALFAAMLGLAFGLPIDTRPALDLLPGRLTSVRDFAAQMLKRAR